MTGYRHKAMHRFCQRSFDAQLMAKKNLLIELWQAACHKVMRKRILMQAVRKTPYSESFVKHNEHSIYVREYAGDGPQIILMHGFPDNLHLHDRLIPYLSPPRHLVAFDFLGWGNSDKPRGYAYTSQNQKLDLDAVIKQLKLGRVVLVAHDASGPPAIDWAIDNSTALWY
jgi:hypothetical protein